MKFPTLWYLIRWIDDRGTERRTTVEARYPRLVGSELQTFIDPSGRITAVEFGIVSA